MYAWNIKKLRAIKNGCTEEKASCTRSKELLDNLI
jgi:hypothetical protein